MRDTRFLIGSAPETIVDLTRTDRDMRANAVPHERHVLALNSEDDIFFALSQKHRQDGLVFIAPPLHSTDKKMYAKSLGIDVSAIEVFPNMKLFGAIEMDHEIKHTFEHFGLFESSLDMFFLYRSYSELFADKKGLVKAGFNNDIAADYICTRAMKSLMQAPPSHWTALHLQALKESSTILRHQDVVASTSGFVIQFLAALEGIRLSHYSTQKINEAGAKAWKEYYQALHGEICAKKSPTDDTLALLACLSTRNHMNKHPVDRRLRVLYRLCTEDRFDDPLAQKLAPLAQEWIERHTPKAMGKRLTGKPIVKILRNLWPHLKGLNKKAAATAVWVA